MPTLVRSLAVTALLAAVVACADEPTAPAAQPPVQTPAPPGFELPEDFDDKVTTYMDGWGEQWPTFKVHGTTAVFADGEAVFSHAWGLRDLAEQTPHTPDDKFEVGTLSVHLTQATTMALVRDGKLALDDPAAKHLELPLPRSITIEHLLTMTSGLPSFVETLLFERVYKRRPTSNAALVASFASDPLEFDPGSDFAPSLSNAAVLGLVIENATGKDYPDAVREHLLEPLGMHDTHYGRVQGASIGLQFNEAEYLDPVVEADPASLGAAGGWTSTAADLGRLYASMLGDHYGQRLALRIWGNNPLERAYGFAPTTVGGRDAYGWVGRFDGHEHGVLVIPSDGVVVLHLANSEVAPGSMIAEAVASMAYDVPVSPREEARPVPIDPTELERFASHWALRPSDIAAIEEVADTETVAAMKRIETTFEQGEGLRLRIHGRPTKRMHTIAPREFFFKDRPQSTARIAGTDAAPMLVLERGGGALHYRPVPPDGA